MCWQYVGEQLRPKACQIGSQQYDARHRQHRHWQVKVAAGRTGLPAGVPPLMGAAATPPVSVPMGVPVHCALL